MEMFSLSIMEMITWEMEIIRYISKLLHSLTWLENCKTANDLILTTGIIIL